MTLCMIASILFQSPTLTPVNLQCEMLDNPIGVGTRVPRLSWKLKATRSDKNLSQSKYRILVASSPATLAKNRGDLWDSGPTISSETAFIPYAGKALESRSACWWKVQVWDQSGLASNWSSSASWTIGLLDTADWKAEWIGFDQPRREAAGKDPFTGAMWIWGAVGQKQTVLRRSFTIDSLVDQATLNITVDDHFTVYINDVKVGQDNPITDSWRKPKSFDVKAALKIGENSIRIEAIDTGGDAGALASLSVRTRSGNSIALTTDRSWQVDVGSLREVAEYGASPWGSPGSPKILPAARYLRSEFQTGPRVKRALLHATAQGIFEVSLNGKKVGDEYFMPGWSNYEKRTYVRTYDVTKMLKAGRNAIGACLADGWFSGYVGYGSRRDHYGKNLRFAAQLEIAYENGTTDLIKSDENWRAAAGPIKFSDFLAGETYDAQLEEMGWNQPGFDERDWKRVDVGTAFKTTLEPFPGQPVRAYAVLKAKTVNEPKPGQYVIDLGQNMAGFARLRVRGIAGQTITLRFAERLNPDGTIYTANLRDAKATDTYICKGGGVETWSPKFTFHGFQYIEVTGLTRAPALDDVVGIALSSDTPEVGAIETSDPMLNRLVKNALWTQRMNFIDIPTDCPQRDERLGWTGDAQAYIRTAAMLTHVHPFFKKWLVSLDDSQREDGQFPMVAPLKVAEGDGGPAWADAGVICPWEIFNVYGDTQLLADHYPAMKRFVEFCRKRSTPDLLPPKEFHCFGDWLNINDPTPNEVIYSAYFAGSARILSQAAGVLSNRADEEEFSELYQRLRRVFQGTYVNADGRIRGDSQTAYILAIAFDLLESDQLKLASAHFARKIEERDGHLSTGFVGTRDIMHVLSKIGRNDLAFKLLHNKTFPSWGFTIANGATSIWERWDGWTPEKGFQDAGMNSFAHYAFGAVVSWMFAQPGGIQNLEPGFRSVRIAPQIDPNLKFMKTRYDSVRGPIVANWNVQGDVVRLHVEIPPNLKAKVILLSRTYEIGSGSYDFSAPVQNRQH